MTTTRGSIDLTNVKESHDDAEQTATKYITKIDDEGIKVHAYDDINQQADTSNYVIIDSDGMEIIKDSVSVADYSDVSRIGKMDEFHTTINSDAFTISDANDENIAFSINATGDLRSITAVKYNRAQKTYRMGSSARPSTSTQTVTKHMQLTPDRVYTFTVFYDSQQTFTYTYSDISTAVTQELDKTATFDGVTCHVYFKFYKSGSRIQVDISESAPWQGSSGDWYRKFPRILVTYPTTITVSNSIINSRTYQLEDLFGTSEETIDLGACIVAGILTSSSSTLNFVIPTGRVFPSGTTISKITFNMIARAGNSNGTGYYMVKSTSGGTGAASFDSSTTSKFYNANNAQKSLTSAMWSAKVITGRTNIRIFLDSGADYFFSGTSAINGYINNNPAVIYLTSIKVTVTLPVNE